MKLFPAIDILNSRAVRLLHGKKDKVTDYGSPLDRALMWKEQGAENLHIVDLDGAFDGIRTSDKIIEKITTTTGLFVQSGGGLRTFDDVKRRLDLGVDKVILGTMIYKHPEVFEKVVAAFGSKIIAGIDALNGFLAVNGWTNSTDIKDIDLCLKMKEMGVDTVVYTDISKDGALTGINIESTVKLSDKSRLNIIASGGLRSVSELEELKQKGVYGAILGRSIYTGDINLKEAIGAV